MIWLSSVSSVFSSENQLPLNLEGFTSAIRTAMFPFTPEGTKIDEGEHCIDFSFPSRWQGLQRTISQKGRYDLIVSKRIVRLMLDLFPPVALNRDICEVDLKDPNVADITKIYIYYIQGLEFALKEYIKDSVENTTLPDPVTFDYDIHVDQKKDRTEAKASEAIKKSINVLKRCCKDGFSPNKKFETLHIRVQSLYDAVLIRQIVASLESLKATCEKPTLKTAWPCEYKFRSLNDIVEGLLAGYKDLIQEVGTLDAAKPMEEEIRVLLARTSAPPVVDGPLAPVTFPEVVQAPASAPVKQAQEPAAPLVAVAPVPAV